MDNMQVIERLSRIESCVTQATQASHRRQVPPPLDDTLAQLEHWAHQAREWLQQHAGEEAEDPARLFECADALKELGDQAAARCDEAGPIADDVKQQVQAAQNEIAQFRRQLHGSENRREARPATRSDLH